MQQFYIRRLRQEDLLLLKKLLAELDTSHYQAEPNFYRSPQDMAQLREEHHIFDQYFDGSSSAFIACSQRQVVGFVSGTTREISAIFAPHRKIGYINELVVTESHRNLGIGLSLIDKIESDLCSQGIEEIGLNVAAFNHAVEDFYHKMGYRVMNKSMTKRFGD